MPRTHSTRLFFVLIIIFSLTHFSFTSVALVRSVVPPGDGLVKGRLTYRGKPVSHASVFLTKEYPPGEKTESYRVLTDEDGYFSLKVPKGTYYVHAKQKGKNSLFAFSGQNPVAISSRERFLGLKAVPFSGPSYTNTETEGASMTGKVLFKGKTVEGAFVYLYSDSSTLFKGMGFVISPPTDEEGRFSLNGLPETDFIVVARKRKGGSMTGPLTEGDLYCFHPQNPISLIEGKSAHVTLECVRKEKDISYASVTSGSLSSVSGTIVNGSGNPVEGAYAFVYEDRVFGHKRPYSHSGKTGPDGRFTVNLDREGTFFLGAREVFGKTPRPGEFFGFYEGTPDHSIHLDRGERLKGVTIVVDKILSGEEGGAGSLPEKSRVYDRGMIVKALEKNTTLKGNIHVKGILVVPKGVTVTIEAGTKIAFDRIDIDGDGIGDGEFYVEGNVIVKGTRGNPVLFTSGESNPGPKDWKYFFVNLSSGSKIEYLISEYAFSGLQVHFSNASVKNSIFRRNVDGLRFSTVKGTFEYNLMSENTYGVRYEERATDAVLRNNVIKGNRVGIFSVLESKGGLTIEGNNIGGNRDYDFKLGNRQTKDIPAGNNWWGARDRPAIEKHIFDGEDVEGLGKVLIEPVSGEPFDAGVR